MANATNIDPRFYDFVLLQAQNAGLFLGQLPNPATGAKSVNLKAAKSVLDSLTMLKDKSQGNLSGEEIELLQKALENLTRLYADAEALG
ncbi:DUF1844 domain-containing protein [Rubritalea marina]|uniref:DUF1844 domain-containing protein n=1 Tax=Rubritalea marina TaxID=361055 RepID=UPI00036D465C|nr:DUF1844 domain-containing protein [Rubritalea marina]